MALRPSSSYPDDSASQSGYTLDDAILSYRRHLRAGDRDDFDLVDSRLCEADHVRAPEAGLRDGLTPTRLEKRQMGAVRIGRRVVVIGIPIPASSILVRNTSPPKVRQWPIGRYPQRLKWVDLDWPDGAQVQWLWPKSKV
jgi:hypothetical protein